MSQLLKTLNEQRGAKLKQGQELTETVTKEDRGFSDDERNKIRGINDEVEKIDQDIEQELRTIANLAKKGPDLSKQEERDLARFNLGKVVRHLDRAYKGQPSQLDGIEAEMIQQGETEARTAGINASGLVLPELILRNRENRATLSVTGGTTNQYGGELVATEKNGILGDFYNSSVLEQKGAMVLTGLVGNVDFPRYQSGTAPAKAAENAAAADVGGTFTALSLTPNRLTGYAEISDQLLAQSDQNVTNFIGSQISRHMSAVKEKAFFHGGGTNEPTGIAGTSGIGSVVGGTNGAAPDYADMVALWKAVAADNADMGSLAYFTNVDVVGKLLQTVRVSSTDSKFILDNLESGFLGREVCMSNAIANDLDKGTSTGVCSAIFYGNAADFVVGYWGGISLEVTRDSSDAKAGKRTLVANTYYDAGVLRAESFSAMLDALTA